MKNEVRRSAEALQHSEFTLRTLLESAVQAILAVNANGNLVLVNKTANEMFSYKPNELLGQPIELLLPTEYRDRHRQHLKGFFLSPRSRPMDTGRLDIQGQRKDGSLFPIGVSLNTMETSEGVLLAVDFISDITGRKRTEAALAESRDEIRALAARLLTDVEDERRRLSRDLHDQICQTLASLAIDIGGLAAKPPPSKEARSQFRALQARVIKAAEEARILRTVDRNDPAGMSGLPDRARRRSCENDSSRVDWSLQSRTPALLVRAWHSGATPGQGSGQRP